MDTLEVSIASEKVTDMEMLTEMEVSSSDGEVEETVGAVVSVSVSVLDVLAESPLEESDPLQDMKPMRHKMMIPMTRIFNFVNERSVTD